MHMNSANGEKSPVASHVTYGLGTQTADVYENIRLLELPSPARYMRDLNPAPSLKHQILRPPNIQIPPVHAPSTTSDDVSNGNEGFHPHNMGTAPSRIHLETPEVDSPLAKNSAGSKTAKRPSNSWIIYRKEKHPHVLAQYPDISNNEISKIIAAMWRTESENIKEKYKARAQVERHKHHLLYPDYKYAPRKNKAKRNKWGKNARNSSSRYGQNPEQPPELDSCEHGSANRWSNTSNTPTTAPGYAFLQGIIPDTHAPQPGEYQRGQKYIFNPYISPVLENMDMQSRVETQQVDVQSRMDQIQTIDMQSRMDRIQPHLQRQHTEPEYYHYPRALPQINTLERVEEVLFQPRQYEQNIVMQPRLSGAIRDHTNFAVYVRPQNDVQKEEHPEFIQQHDQQYNINQSYAHK